MCKPQFIISIYLKYLFLNKLSFHFFSRGIAEFSTWTGNNIIDLLGVLVLADFHLIVLEEERYVSKIQNNIIQFLGYIYRTAIMIITHYIFAQEKEANNRRTS